MRKLDEAVAYLRRLETLPVMMAASKGPEAMKLLADALEEIRARLREIDKGVL